jgi:hypothetical protein
MDFASVIDQVVKHSAPYTADRAGDLLFDVLTGLCPGHKLRPDFSLVERSAHGEQATIVDRVEDLLAQLSWAADEEQRTFTCQLMSRLVICSHDLTDLADHPLMPGKMVDVVWLDVHLDRGTVFTTVPDAVLRSIRERIIASDGFSRYINSAQPERSIIQTLVLIVTVDGPSMQAPELMLVGPALVDESKGGLPLTGVISLGIGRVLRKGAPIAEQRQELDSRLRRLLQPFSAEVTDPTGFRRAFGVAVKDEKGLRDLLFKNMRDALQSLMQCMVDTRRVVEPSFAWAEGDPKHLREAATLVAYRLMFLLETQRRGLLLTGSSRGKATLLELVSQAGIDGEAPVAGKLAKGLLWYTRVMRGEYQADNVRLKGASIFANQPSDAFPDDTGLWAGTFDAVEQLSTDEHGPLLKRWDSALARAGSVISGGLERADSAATGSEASLGLVGGGAEEHKQRILGDIYEQILAMVPQRVGDTDEVKLSVAGSDGNETNDRKKLGAHYTPQSIVEEVVRAAMGPMFAHRWSQATNAAPGKARNYQALLRDLKVLDPAMGSGHFLTVAAVEIAREIAWAEVFGEPQPEDNFEVVTRPDPWTALSERAWESDEDRESAMQMLHAIIRRELRGIVQGCCYGVDVSPLAVELGKLSLWLFTMSEDDSPESVSLAFLDGNLLCGDSLTGMSWPEVKHELQTRLKVDLNKAQTELGGLGGPTPEQRQQRLQKLANLLRGDEIALRQELKHGGLRDVPLDHRSIDTLDSYALRKRAWEWVRGETAREEWLYDLATVAVFSNAGGRKEPDSALRAFIREHGGQPELIEPSWENLVSDLYGGSATAEVVRYREAIHHAARHALVVGGRKLLTLHYPLALPHVFTNDSDGFDVVVGNPPFVGDKVLRQSVGERTTEFYATRHTRSSRVDFEGRAHRLRRARQGGIPDLCGFFVLRAQDLLTEGTALTSHVATNTLAQGKNREQVLLAYLRESTSNSILRAVSSRPWPTEAAVHYSLLTLLRGVSPPPRASLVRPTESGEQVIHVRAISTFLDDLPEIPARSLEPVAIGFRRLPSAELVRLHQGMIVRGADKETDGFIHHRAQLTDIPLAERSVWKTYLTSEYVLSTPVIRTDFIVADLFAALTDAAMLKEAAGAVTASEVSNALVQLDWLREHFPVTLRMIDGVRREREKLPDSPSNEKSKRLWWLFEAPRPELRRELVDRRMCYAFPRVAKCWLPFVLDLTAADFEEGFVPSEMLFLAPAMLPADFAISLSALFEQHARKMSSSLETRLRFNPTDCVSTFPLWTVRFQPDDGSESRCPEQASRDGALAEAGEEYLSIRNRTMQNLSIGPTAFMNEVDNPLSELNGIRQMRSGMRSLLAAVMTSSGWNELVERMYRDSQSLTDNPDECHGWEFERQLLDGTWRYVPAARWRREMHERLLQANEDRYWEEINLYLQNLPAELLPRARGGGRAVQTVKDITKLCKKAAFKITPADVEALWYEGERQGLWERGE